MIITINNTSIARNELNSGYENRNRTEVLELKAPLLGSSLSPGYQPCHLGDVLMLMLTLAFPKLHAAFQFLLLISHPIKGFPVLPILLPCVDVTQRDS